MYLENIKFQQEIKKDTDILICLRKDKEKVIDNKIGNIILELKNRYSLKYTDTVINSFILPDKRKEYVEEKILEFVNSKIVITDRLHGMIFAFLTKTPCIALNNSSGKVLGVYEWIKECGYIKVINDIEEIPKLIEILLKQKINGKNLNMKERFQRIKNFLI